MSETVRHGLLHIGAVRALPVRGISQPQDASASLSGTK